MTRMMLRATRAAALCLALAAAASAEEITVRGRLGNTVEAGGWLILTAKEKYLLLNARRWKDEPWFRAGAGVEAQGSVRKDAVTVYMEGTPFEARTLRPGGGDGGDGAPQSEVTAKSSGATRVVVTGEARVQARPDTAVVTVAVVTQAGTALAAQQENARKTEAVVRAVRAAAGAGAEVETSGYSLQPQYSYRPNEPPLIQGYQARNAVTVTLSDLTKVGPTIDAAAGAGANNVDQLSFTLRRDRPAREQALAGATREALAKAQAIAAALGGRLTRVVEVAETTDMPRPIPAYRGEVMSARAAQAEMAPTPIETGTLDVRSRVQLVAEIAAGQ